MESPLNEVSCLSTSSDGKERATTEVSLAEQEPQDDSKQNNCNNSSNSNNDNNTPTTTTFEMGDHVYQWVSFMGIPGVYQHHGIVMDGTFFFPFQFHSLFLFWSPLLMLHFGFVVFDDTIRIADFSNNPNTTSKKKSLRNHAGSGQIRLYDVPCAQSTWHKVVYQASWWRRHTSRSGTCTACGSDPPGLVRSRVQFLLDHPTVIPQYNAVHSNCECVALWCKTGTWATLQAASWLACTAASQVKSTLMVSGAAAASQVTVPAAGLWGYLGYTAHVSLLSTQPLLLPAIVGYGVVSAGTPALWLAYARKYWKTTTETLNQSFWDAAIENPEIFVECIVSDAVFLFVQECS